MSVFKYFLKTLRACDMPSFPSIGLLPEHSVSMKEAQGAKTTQVNARMATADHDRQGQAAHTVQITLCSRA